ncbi:hypothetical protein ACKKBG_A10420 [Auxenochlorella protothecoides x Auxenochlorella symbiontica]
MTDNPFNDNPFGRNQTNGSQAASAGPWATESSAGAWGTGAPAATPAWAEDVTTSAFAAPAPMLNDTVPAAPGVKNTKTEKNLDKREADLNRREAELRRLEQELRAGGAGSLKNWPPYCAFTYHDIRAEIPQPLQGMVRSAYWAYLGLVLCLFFNFVGTAAYLIGVDGGGIAAFLWGGLYMLGGVPLAWFLWYRRVYSAAMKDSAFQYGLFFAMYMAHLIFVGWSVVAPPILNSSSHTGFWEAINVISDNTGVGVMYFIGAALWAVEFLWSFWVLKLVYSCFRGQGHTVRSVKNDAAATGVRSQV